MTSTSGHPVRASDPGARLFLGFLLAPTAALLVVWVVLTWGLLRVNHQSVADTLELLLLVFAGGGPFAYPLALFVGLPAYHLITRVTALARWHVLTLAVLTATAGLMFTGFPMRDRIVMGVLAGAVAGVTFWRCWTGGRSD